MKPASAAITAPVVCHECERPARAAIRVTRPSRADLRITLYADDRVAPKTAIRYCHEHTVATLTALARTVVDGDE